ncbi:MAG: hypothetical protein HC770_04170 [Pseudanabaena sp. CRU_2_10]|nr:hypothetical protein [Pseudanabaena sp. CRU_2_10]
MQRLLGASEHTAWLHDRDRPLHFVLTAQIAGEIDVTDVKRSLLCVQQKHPLLRTRIVVDKNEQPMFVSEGVSEIPLRVLERRDEEHWCREVERELHQPFDWEHEPLLRVVLLHSKHISELILICYHSIGDGLSSLYLIQDILMEMSEPCAIPSTLPPQPFLEAMLHQSDRRKVNPFLWTLARIGRIPIKSSMSPYPTRQPRLLYWSLTPTETAALITRSRQEQTTVHGALCATMLSAIASQSSNGQSHFKCLSPISIRDYLSPCIGRDFGFYFSLGITNHPIYPDTSLWEIARQVKMQLEPQMSRDSLFGDVSLRQAFLASKPSPQKIMAAFLQRFESDAMVTNLGRAGIAQQFGKLKLKAVYGPAVFTGMHWERILGVTTLGDRMFFTLAYSESSMSQMEANKLKHVIIEQLRSFVAKSLR